MLAKRINESKASLELIRCGLWDEDIDEVIDLISKNPRICSLNLSENSLSDISAIKLLSLKNVTSLQLSKVDIGNEGAIALVKHRNFTRLDLSKNQLIDNKAGREILILASQIYLDLSHTAINPDILNGITLKVKQNNSIYYEELNKSRHDRSENSSPLIDNNLFGINREERIESKEDSNFDLTNENNKPKLI
jgi:hypothetical protein